MPRFVYWTILLGAEPTAFRARDRAELVGTLKQLQRHRPDAVLKWFAGGRLWDSPEDARETRARERREAEPRGREWRPGGTHRDPRERYKVPREVKKRRILERMRHDAAQTGSTRSRPPERLDSARPPRRPPQGSRDDWRSPPESFKPSSREGFPSAKPRQPTGPRGPGGPRRDFKPSSREGFPSSKPGHPRVPGKSRPPRGSFSSDSREGFKPSKSERPAGSSQKRPHGPGRSSAQRDHRRPGPRGKKPS